MTPKWQSEPAPITGNVIVIIYPVDNKNNIPAPLYGERSIITDVNVGTVSQQQVEIKQSETTARKTNNPSPVVIEPQKSQLGDASYPDGDLFNAGTVYISTIYESDASTPAKNGYSGPTLNFPEPLNSVAATDAMILQSKVAKIFQGDIYGFVPLLSRVNVNNVSGIFSISSWEWNAFDNIIQLELYEVFWENQQPPTDPNPWFDDLDVEIIDTDEEVNSTTTR